MSLFKTTVFGIFATIAMFAFGAGSASAQATRTWVSGVGDDANPCSRTAPCKTFAGAISKTAANGEIDCLDPGGFGAVTIVKSITIDCGGVTGGILSSFTNGVIINVTTANAHVILRNLSINGGGTGLDGVRILAGRFVKLENLLISGLTGDGIELLNTAPNVVGLDIDATSITNTVNGLNITGTGPASVGADQLSIDSSTNGVTLASSAFVSISNSEFHQLTGFAIGTTAGAGVMIVAGSAIARSGTAFSSGSAGSQIRISDNYVMNNATGFSISAGTIATGGNNTIEGNGGATVPNASFTLK